MVQFPAGFVVEAILVVCSRGAAETFASGTENNWLVFAAFEFARVLVSDLLRKYVSVRIGAAINVADMADAARPEPRHHKDLT